MVPKWMTALSATLETYPESKTYALATIGENSPRVRHIVHRSFISPNGNVPLLISTTDIRSPKVSQIIPHRGQSHNAEIVWWIQEPNEQYRITGRVYILPISGHPLHSQFPAQRLAPEERENGDAAAWWEIQRIDTFDNKMGGALRASFCRPTPGSELPGGYESGREWPDTLPQSTEAERGSVDEKNVWTALNNFALMVLEPVSVDRIELSAVPNRRTCWMLAGHGVWTERILVP